MVFKPFGTPFTGPLILICFNVETNPEFKRLRLIWIARLTPKDILMKVDIS